MLVKCPVVRAGPADTVMQQIWGFLAKLDLYKDALGCSHESLVSGYIGKYHANHMAEYYAYIYIYHISTALSFLDLDSFILAIPVCLPMYAISNISQLWNQIINPCLSHLHRCVSACGFGTLSFGGCHKFGFGNTLLCDAAIHVWTFDAYCFIPFIFDTYFIFQSHAAFYWV